MLLRETWSEHCIEPVGIGAVVVVHLKGVLHIKSGSLLVGDPILGAEEFSSLAKETVW